MMYRIQIPNSEYLEVVVERLLELGFDSHFLLNKSFSLRNPEVKAIVLYDKSHVTWSDNINVRNELPRLELPDLYSQDFINSIS